MSHSVIAASAPPHLVVEGTLLAGILGIASGAVGVVWLFGAWPRDASALALSLGGMAGAGVGLALSWRLLVPSRGRFSLPMAVLAGLAGAVAAHLLAWMAFFVAGSLIAAESLPDLARAFTFTITMLGMSMILASMVTVPAGIAIAVAVTLWCNWRSLR